MLVQSQYVKFIFFAILILTGCKKKSEEFHPKCGSKFCSINGQTEIQELLQKNPSSDTLIFKIQLIDAANQKKNYAKLLSIENELNYVFKKARIKFKVNPIIKRLTNKENIDSLFNNVNLKNKLLQTYNIANVINLYLVPRGTALNGYTNVLTENFKLYPFTEYNYLIINEFAIFNGNTIEHEFGHFFGLQHTFGKSPMENSTDENINGSNCEFAGDFICDTPADPNGVIDKDCKFIGLSNGIKYLVKPDVTNFMSYYPANCKMRFSDQQLLLIQNFAHKYRYYLSNKPRKNNTN